LSDTVTAAVRSRIMRSVRRFDTKPEVLLRKAVHRYGFRYRIHRTDLPGTPDFTLPRYRLAVFVNGCFWHRHPGCRKSTFPKTRKEWWEDKFRANVARDERNYRELKAMGWRVFIAWQCEIEGDLKGTVARLIKRCRIPLVR
jgi:DNA mismatch endonuclease (patch repair protein)